ncbi:unnamed protein product [Parascedosporium putredinis]|uniref:Uncharacterized protein n=1 Tax=Parascedosporium putredinis TaxID=1442378 RepID=A0A9P1MEK4_9PEZI|nr:unnamed protein product [Parascedosporium putredinis]CAI8001742.1 unnamed protein product [Parascedosporium putredinis]
MRTQGTSSEDQIRNHIYNNFLAPDPNRPRLLRSLVAPPYVRVTFNLDWDPLQFILQQDYPLPPEEAFGQIICLTGTWQEAQVSTIAEYMSEMWPITSKGLLTAVKQHLADPTTVSTCTILHNQTIQLRNWSLVEAQGPLGFVAEIGEQLGWLSSAMRSNPLSKGVVACSPSIKTVQIAEAGFQHDKSLAAHFNIHSDISVNQDISSADRGFCWANLFETLS